jgi:hypothetical protein
VNDQDDFSSRAIHVDHHFLNQRSHDPFLQASIDAGVVPNNLQVRRQFFNLLLRGWPYCAWSS